MDRNTLVGRVAGDGLAGFVEDFYSNFTMGCVDVYEQMRVFELNRLGSEGAEGFVCIYRNEAVAAQRCQCYSGHGRR